MIAYFALHQLGYGDIMLPEDADYDDDGVSRAEFTAQELISHCPIDDDGRVYYDAVACYNERGLRVRIFSTSPKWLAQGEWVSVSARNHFE